jgi:hypothetical protein
VINVFSDNGLPARVQGQMYFLNEARNKVLDSFFIGDLVIAGGQTDASGNPTFINSQKAVVPITRKKLENMKQARFVATRFEFNTAGYPGLFVSANKTPRLTIQFTGDLNIRVAF